MKKSSAYWKKRFISLEEASNAYGQKTFIQVEKQFEIAERQLQKEIDLWVARVAVNNDLTMQAARKLLSASELAEFKWDVNQYIEAGMKHGADPAWMKQLENASAKFHISRLEALKVRTQQACEVAFGNELDAVDSLARKVYTENYYHSIFEVQKGFNIGWNIGEIDQKKLDKVISRPWATDGKDFSSRIWSQKQKMIAELHQQLTRTCILGKAPDDAIAELEKYVSKKVKSAKSSAAKLVQTEQAYFHSVSQKDAFDELDVEEFEIVATLDSHTSEICQEMDGQHFPMKDYEPGVTAPPFHPWCRSVTAPYFDDNYGGERAARGADGKTYYVPDSMTYKEWKDSLVDGDTSGLKETSPGDILKIQAIDGQISLLKKYGNVESIMLKGSSDELDEWVRLQKTSGQDEKSILKELSKEADGWETILETQTEKSMTPFVNQLLDVATDAELGALNLWTGETYANINRYMRFGTQVDDISITAAKNIEAVLDKLQTPEEIIVKRGTGTKHIFEKMVGDWKADPSVLVGQEFVDKGFTATSPLKEGGFSGVGASQAELFIKIPKGTHGAYIAHEAHNELEKEFLLQRGYTFRIVKAEYRPNPLFPDEDDLKVWCEVILDE